MPYNAAQPDQLTILVYYVNKYVAVVLTITYTSFLVDIIVYFYMQSSTFRFSYLTVSRIECMLRRFSLDLTFSSKRVEGNVYEVVGDRTVVMVNRYEEGLSDIAVLRSCAPSAAKHYRVP